ncbi:MAG: hypothetical protein HQK51_07390 [Oligoflexia bacterium]|nr:hypothetical protein [Oligoflexia bacterium]
MKNEEISIENSNCNSNESESKTNSNLEQLINGETNIKKSIIKKCHLCGNIIESYTEVQKCPSCKKHFLPTNYFTKLQKLNNKNDYSKMFSNSDELSEEDLIKGLQVLW